MDQGEIDPSLIENNPEAEKTLPEPERLGSTDTTLEREEVEELLNQENAEVREEECIEKPQPGRPRGYWTRFCGDYYTLRNPGESIRKENVRKQFIRGFRTAIEQVFASKCISKGCIHRFDVWDEYRKGKWREFQLAVQHSDLRTVVKKAGEKETEEESSFNTDFCKAILAAPEAAEAFKVYVQLVFGGNQEGLEQRLNIGVRATSKYEKSGYWERLQDYLAREMLAEFELA